jgi:hypothetical protein
LAKKNKKLLLKQILTYFNRYILRFGLSKEYVWMLLKVFLLIIMVVIIYMVNILTTRENRVLSFNSIIQTSPWGRSYSYKNSNSGEAPIALQGKGLDPN